MSLLVNKEDLMTVQRITVLRGILKNLRIMVSVSKDIRNLNILRVLILGFQ